MTNVPSNQTKPKNPNSLPITDLQQQQQQQQLPMATLIE